MVQKRIECHRVDPEGTAPLKLILLDWEMPVMDGRAFMVEFLKLFEQQETANIVPLRRPMVCCMSAHTSETIKQVALNAGMDFFLTKPTPMEDMKAFLKRCHVL